MGRYEAKAILTTAMAILSIGASSVTSQAATHQQISAAKAINASQQTSSFRTDIEYDCNDKYGSALIAALSSAQDTPAQDFIHVSTSCDKAISDKVKAVKIARSKKPVGSRSDMYGRLVIPSVGIDVALIIASGRDYCQAVTDASDSAAIQIGPFLEASHVISDHNNQDFRTLTNVTVGTPAYIETTNGRINLVCSTVFDGHNTDTMLTDGNYNNLVNVAEYLCYTCLDSWRNIRIVGFNTV